MPGRAIKATRLSNRLQPRATRSLRASLVHSLDQSPVHGATVNKELLRTVTNTTQAAQQGAWATRFDAGQAGGECRRQATTDRARPTDGRNGPNGSAPQCVQRCAASPIHANRRLCSEDQPAQLRTRSQQPTGGQQSSTPAGMRGPPQPQVAPYVMLCAKHRAKMASLHGHASSSAADEHTAMGEVHPQGQLALRGALANQPALSCQGRREGSASIHQQPSGCWCEPYSTRRAERSAEP